MTGRKVSKQLRWQRERAAAKQCIICGDGELHRHRKCRKCWKAWLLAQQRFVERELKTLESLGTASKALTV